MESASLVAGPYVSRLRLNFADLSDHQVTVTPDDMAVQESSVLPSLCPLFNIAWKYGNDITKGNSITDFMQQVTSEIVASLSLVRPTFVFAKGQKVGIAVYWLTGPNRVTTSCPEASLKSSMTDAKLNKSLEDLKRGSFIPERLSISARIILSTPSTLSKVAPDPLCFIGQRPAIVG